MRRYDTALNRLVEVYGLMEEVRRAEMQRAMGSVVEAESAGITLRAIYAEANAEGRRALERGHHSEWTLAESRSSLVNLQHGRVEALHLERKKILDVAMEHYRISRVEKDQMAQLLRNAMQQAKKEAARREQAASDDRFLSRTLWRKRGRTKVSEL